MADLGSLLGAAGLGGAIGQAIVRLELDSSKYTAELKAQQANTQASANAMGSSFTKFAGIAKSGALVAAAAVVGFAAVAVKAAADLGESLNKAQVVFGQASKSVIEFSETTATKLGIAQSAALEAAAGFGAMVQSAGLSAKAAARMSIELVTLAADMASLNNVDPSDMLERLRSGLAGEAEPLRKFGVFVSEARVKTEAYASGIADLGAELTDAQKIQARFNIIMQDTAKAQGDFARTSESLPNQLRILKAEFTDLAAKAGQDLIPAVTSFVGALRDILPVLGPVLAALADLLDLLGRVATALSLKESGFAEYTARLEELGRSFDTGKIGIIEYENELLALRAETGRHTEVTAAYVQQLQQAEDALLRGQQAEFEYTAAQREATEAAKAARAAALGVTEAILAQADAYLALVDPVFAVISAVNADKDAERALADARDRLDRLTERGLEGTKKYAQAQDEVSLAALAAARAHAGLIGSVDALRTALETGTKQDIRDAIAALKNMGQQAGLTKKEIGELVDGVREGLDEAGRYAESHAPEVGRTLAQGIAAGIEQYTHEVSQQAAFMIRDAIAAARAEAAAASPSKKMHELGVDMMLGLIQGLQSQESATVAAYQKIIDHIAGEFERQVTALQDRLSRLQGKAGDLRGAVTGGFGSFLDISGAFELGTGADVQSFFAQQLAGAEQFAAILKALQTQGISSALLQQIASAGPQAIPFAQQLLQLGPTGIAGISGAFGTISELASSTAQGLSEAYFGTKIDELRDELRQLREALRVLERPQRLELVFRPGGDRALRQLILEVIQEVGLSRASV
jgi:hypothetical protein